MVDISNIEKSVIQLSSLSIAFLMFGPVEITRVPIEAGMMTIYEKMRGETGRIRELYDKNIYRALSHEH